MKLSSCNEKISQLSQQLNNSKNEINKLHNEKQHIQNEFENFTSKYDRCKEELSKEHENHIEWCQQMKRQLQDNLQATCESDMWQTSNDNKKERDPYNAIENLKMQPDCYHS